MAASHLSAAPEALLLSPSPSLPLALEAAGLEGGMGTKCAGLRANSATRRDAARTLWRSALRRDVSGMPVMSYSAGLGGIFFSLAWRETFHIPPSVPV